MELRYTNAKMKREGKIRTKHVPKSAFAVTNKDSINRELQRLSAHYASAATSTAGSGSFGTTGPAALLWRPAPASSSLCGTSKISFQFGYPFLQTP